MRSQIGWWVIKVEVVFALKKIFEFTKICKKIYLAQASL